MSQSCKKKTTTTLTSDIVAKKLYRQIWEYGQRIERSSKATKHTVDLFKPELKSLRKKFVDKCSKLLLFETAFSNKVEELVWKRGFYDVVQRCKQHPEVLDSGSPLSQSYSRLITSAMRFYERLLHKMERQFGMEHSQLSHTNGQTLGGTQWIKDIMYKCFIHLGDLARYQVSLGGDTFVAVAYYHEAITLDPTIGTAFNQLAVLVGNKNEYLDSIYYYQRSVISPQPFSGSEANMMSLFEKNDKALKEMQARLAHITEPDMMQTTRKILLLRFIRLQHILYPGKKTAVNGDKNFSKLCEETLENFRQCLEYDLQVFKENCNNTLSSILFGKKRSTAPDKVLLPQDVLLKLAALSILPSYSLRQLGSTLTPVATAFALSIFSHLLEYSFQCIAFLVVNAVRLNQQELASSDRATEESDESDIMSALESGKSMVDILLEHNVSSDVSCPSDTSGPIKETQGKSSVDSSSTSKSTPKKQKKVKIVDRRRRRKGGVQVPSSEEEDSGDSDSLSNDDDSSDEDLSLGEDDLELMSSFSDSSSEEEDNEVCESAEDPIPSKVASSVDNVAGTKSSESAKRGGKRQIVLAANFNMPPSSSGVANQSTASNPKLSNKENKNDGDSVPPRKPLLSALLLDDRIEGDGELKGLMRDTIMQTTVHTACSLVAEESSLISLRVFTYWLFSYPIVIATCTQSSATMWSRIAYLLNILPSQQEILTTYVDGSYDVKKQPLVEDVILREFAPIAPVQNLLQFGEGNVLSSIQETSCRIHSLQSFGHFLAEARTAPLFSWDSSKEKFVGPAQKASMDRDRMKVTEEVEKKQAELNRSKLMKAMAQQRLQSEVESLAEASSKEKGTVFTPYLIPDPNSLCTGLHIVKKLLKTEKFIFIITKAVIESLDSMKKGRESYAAREAIKFLEKELHGGNKFIQPQKVSESLNRGKKKPIKMEMQDWLFEQLVDCACYFNQTYGRKGQSQAVVTLIIEKRILDMFNNPATKEAEQTHVTEMLATARQSGVDLETVIGFHINWSKNSKKKMQS